MKEFVPTWLYIKCHNETGLRYFGKTINDPHNYYGSGKYWIRHLKKYGYNISTIWCQLFTDKESLLEFALNFSIENKIIKSRGWANLKNETGTDGGIFGPITEEYRQKLKGAKTDEIRFLNGSVWRNKKQPEWVIEKRKESLKRVEHTSEWNNKVRLGVIESYRNPSVAMINKYSKISEGNKQWGWITDGLENKRIKKNEINEILNNHTAWRRGRTL